MQLTCEAAVKFLTSAAALLACGDSGRPWTLGPILTDRVVVDEVYDPKVGSGVFAIYAKVTATTPASEKRDYSILYMGEGQTLPSIGASCAITYRYDHLARLPGDTGKIVEWRGVDRFECNDGKHYPDGSPRYLMP